MLSEFITEHKLPATFASSARKWFLPVAQQLEALVVARKGKIGPSDKSETTPVFLGINGCQGSGKSTLAALLNHYLSTEPQLNVVNLSLDDFYLSQNARQSLAEDVHPLLATRGVPGTHDIDLLHTVLKCLKNGQRIALPRFDKSQDNPFPRVDWLLSPAQVDVVIIEGWCWGVAAEQEDSLENPVNLLERIQDQDAIWRRYVNQQLQQYYQPLYAFMDKWLMLKAPSFDCVKHWRWQQEQKLAEKVSALQSENDIGKAISKTASKPSNPIENKVMTHEQVMSFISYFQRLTEHGLTTLPPECDLVFSLDEQRQITALQGAI